MIAEDEPSVVLKLLADDVRWRLLKILAISDRRVQELAAALGQPMNVVSYHLKRLRAAGLVSTRRSDADGRDIYYRMERERLRSAFLAAGRALHPALGQVGATVPRPGLATRDVPVRVLFLCTHNSARSQMAEGLLRTLGGARVEVASAGSEPSGVHPDAIQTMAARDIDISAQQAQHVSRYEDMPFDYVITVCDLAREVCPTFPGGAQQLHWSLPDPAAIPDAVARAEAFARTAADLHAYITYFLMTLDG